MSAPVIVAGPVVKCVGGKTSSLPRILPELPQKIRTYYEPFLGGGAVFFALAAEGRFERAVLGDVNDELVNFYQVLRDRLGELLPALAEHAPFLKRQDSGHFYEVRALHPEDLFEVERAARFLYLNKACFNGLYRVNRHGRFNVPAGRSASPPSFDEARLGRASEALRGAEVRYGSYGAAAAEAGHGDAIFCDPPYWPTSKTASFTAYDRESFTSVHQRELAAWCFRKSNDGAHVVASNADVPEVRALYSGVGFDVMSVQVRRSVNSDPEKRGKVGELLMVREP